MTRRPPFANRYRLDRQLGSGAGGTVDLAFDEVAGRYVALKRARLEDQAVTWLQREYRALSGLGHPVLPRAFEFGRDEKSGQCYFTMEPVRGESLDAYAIRNGGNAAASLLVQACSGLDFLHRQSLIHGDLKPHNLLVQIEAAPRSDAGETPLLRIIDLGLVGESQVPSGTLRGTPRYTEPAVLAGGSPDAGSDLFALGASFADAFGWSLGHWQAEREPTGELAPRLRQVLERLLDPDGDVRYRDARAVTRDLVPDLSARSRSTIAGPGHQSATFQGRSTLLNRVLSAIVPGTKRRADPGPTKSGRTFLVRGEDGLGKSRLLTELRRQAELRFAPVLHAGCQPGLSKPWQALEATLELCARRTGRSAPDRQGRDEQALELLRRAARPAGLLLLVDDVQWCDRESGRLLRWLLTSDGHVPGLVLVLAERTPLVEGAYDWEAVPGVELLRLKRLEPGACEALTQSILDAPASVHRRIASVAEGHPGHAEALARALRGTPVERLDHDLDTLVPRSLADTLVAERDELETDQAKLLCALAVERRPVTRAWFAAFEAAGAFRAGAHDLVQRGLLVAAPEMDHFGFRSELLRASLVKTLDSADRRLAHRAALRAWLEVDSELDEVLAEHGLGAGEHATAWRHGLCAVRELVDQHAAGRAVDLASALERLPLSPPDAERSELAELRGDAELERGHTAAARVCYERAVPLSADSEGRVRLRRKRAVCALFAGELETARRLLHEALEAAQATPVSAAEVAQVFERLGQVEFRLGAGSAARQALEQGLGVLDDAERDPVAASLWNNLGILAMEAGDYEESYTLHEKALRIRDLNGDFEGRSRSLTNLGNVCVHTGRLERARSFYAQSLDWKRRFGNPREIALTLSNLGHVDLLQARYASAIERIEECTRLRSELGDHGGEIRSRTLLAEAWRRKAHYRQALGECDTVRRLVRATGEGGAGWVGLLVVEAWIELDLGRFERVAELVREGMSWAEGHPVDAALLLVARANLPGTDPAEAIRDHEQALGLARSAAEPYVLARVLLSCARAKLSRSGDVAAPSPGEAGEVQELVEEARSLATATGLHELEGVAALFAGVLALESDERTLAAQELHRARTLGDELGVPELRWRAFEALGRLHRKQGSERRSLSWLRRCTGVFREVLTSLGDPGLEAAYIAQPQRAAVLDRLERWVQAGPGRHRLQ